MKKLILACTLLVTCSLVCNAQFAKIKVDKAVSITTKGAKSFMLTDA